MVLAVLSGIGELSVDGKQLAGLHYVITVYRHARQGLRAIGSIEGAPEGALLELLGHTVTFVLDSGETIRGKIRRVDGKTAAEIVFADPIPGYEREADDPKSGAGAA